MKVTISFKTPDAFMYALDRDDYESEEDYEDAKQELENFASQWVNYGESIQVEFDTTAGTANVVKRKPRGF